MLALSSIKQFQDQGRDFFHIRLFFHVIAQDGLDFEF